MSDQSVKAAFNRREASIYTGLSEMTLRRLDATDRLPKVTIGRRVLYTKQSLDNLIQAHLQPVKTAQEAA